MIQKIYKIKNNKVIYSKQVNGESSAKVRKCRSYLHFKFYTMRFSSITNYDTALVKIYIHKKKKDKENIHIVHEIV